MNTSEAIKKIRVKESIEAQCKSLVEEKIDRYLEIEHQGGYWRALFCSRLVRVYLFVP